MDFRHYLGKHVFRFQKCSHQQYFVFTSIATFSRARVSRPHGPSFLATTVLRCETYLTQVRSMYKGPYLGGKTAINKPSRRAIGIMSRSNSWDTFTLIYREGRPPVIASVLIRLNIYIYVKDMNMTRLRHDPSG
jgi:hypothetical protein